LKKLKKTQEQLQNEIKKLMKDYEVTGLFILQKSGETVAWIHPRHICEFLGRLVLEVDNIKKNAARFLIQKPKVSENDKNYIG